MKTYRRQYSHLMFTFLLFFAVELIVACPSYALLNYVGVADLYCDTPADDHQAEEDRCLICVVKSSIVTTNSRPVINLVSEESEVPVIFVASLVSEIRIHSIRPPPGTFETSFSASQL